MYSPAIPANKVGTEITIPYFTKSTNLNFMPFDLTSELNIIPANAPMGVKNAPRLDPKTLAYIPIIKFLPLRFVKTEE